MNHLIKLILALGLFGSTLSHAADAERKTAIVLNSGDASVSLIDMNQRQVYKNFHIAQ